MLGQPANLALPGHLGVSGGGVWHTRSTAPDLAPLVFSTQALQKLHELAFIPLERSRVDACVRASQQLHPAVADRLADVLAAAADTIAALRDAVQAGGAGSGGLGGPVGVSSARERLHTLRGELDALCVYTNGVSHRISRSVYAKLCETAAGF